MVTGIVGNGLSSMGRKCYDVVGFSRQISLPNELKERYWCKQELEWSQLYAEELTAQLGARPTTPLETRHGAGPRLASAHAGCFTYLKEACTASDHEYPKLLCMSSRAEKFLAYTGSERFDLQHRVCNCARSF